MLNIEVLNIYLNNRLIGRLSRTGNQTETPRIRFVAEDDFATDPQQGTVSISMRALNPQQQASLWKDISAPLFNGVDGQLPNFFQNMLPEGECLIQLAQERCCHVDDHFALFSACGLDLPGAIKAMPARMSREELARLVPHENDAFEMTITAEPLPLGVSVSGMQPKVCLVECDGRYMAKRPDSVAHIIGKLPQIYRPLLPEVEHLGLLLASAAGANVCHHKLVPLDKLIFRHGYKIGEGSNFLAVTRFDRQGEKRIHCEDFSQALDVVPLEKYTGASYSAMAALMMRFPETLGLTAVHELIRLITINQLLGNFDGHLKNFCLLYEDSKRPVLSKAFDIVAWSAYVDGSGNALEIYRDTEKSECDLTRKFLDPTSLREFCYRAGVSERPCAKIIKETSALAYSLWPALIEKSHLLDEQKIRVLNHLNSRKSA